MLVFGIETDFSFSGIKGGGNTSPSWNCVTAGGCVTDVKWFGTARARVGYAYDRLMVYGTGGLAYGSVHTAILGTIFDSTQKRSGWTLGGGFEYAFAPNWSGKLEYLHVDLGHGIQWAAFIGGTDPGLTRAPVDIVRAGVNYRFFSR